MKIFKYPFKVSDEVRIGMPLGAHILTVQVQHGEPCIWAIVDPEQPHELRSFLVIGTGHLFSNDLSKSRYIGTFQLEVGYARFSAREVFVGHLFEPKRR
ncbi:MAG: hypothetical protein KAR06_02880 [Deltaproteobacteria bacterium]|nr:hypothetical protein [Deltaproteobacteria bacterium]